jgi:hypothetical protein
MANVQVPNFNIPQPQQAISPRLGQGIGQLIGGIRQRGRQEEQATEQQRIRSEGSQLASIIRETDPTRRTALISTFAQRANPQFRQELEQFGQLPFEQQDLVARASLTEDNLESLIPQGVPGKVGAFRFVDAGDRIEVRDSRTGAFIETIMKGTTRAEQIEAEQKLEEREIKIEERKEKREFTKQQRTDSTQGLIDQSQSGLDLINEIRINPGFSSAVGAKGASSFFGLLDEPIAGSEAAGVVSLIETLEAKNFLVGIKQFKSSGGAGSLSDAEGRKLGAAITNLKRATSEKAFLRNLKTIETLLLKQKSQASKRLPKAGSGTPETQETIINFEDL